MYMEWIIVKNVSIWHPATYYDDCWYFFVLSIYTVWIWIKWGYLLSLFCARKLLMVYIRFFYDMIIFPTFGNKKSEKEKVFSLSWKMVFCTCRFLILTQRFVFMLFCSLFRDSDNSSFFVVFCLYNVHWNSWFIRYVLIEMLSIMKLRL